jgi:hypothetical protein
MLSAIAFSTWQLVIPSEYSKKIAFFNTKDYFRSRNSLMPGMKHLVMKIRLSSLILSLVLMAAFTGCSNSRNEKAVNDSKNVKAPVSGIRAESDTAKADIPEIKLLAGKWQRSDGNYTIEVFSVAPGGKADAGYFNPGPIHVEKAEWKTAENRLYFRIILKDVNYPGSNYTLEYIPGKDVLVGNYFQAVQGVNYDVTFTRIK